MNNLKSLSDCNGIWTHNHLVRKRPLNHLPKLVKRSIPVKKLVKRSINVHIKLVKLNWLNGHWMVMSIPVKILTWNLDQELNFTRETKQRQKVWRWRHVSKLWRHYYFADLWSNWNSGCIDCKSSISINCNLLPYKIWKQN